MAFLTHFQLSVWYGTGTHFLISLKQDIATHISHHIYEWRCWRHLIKFEISNELLTEWFTKSFISKIYKDIAMGGCVTKEKAITCAQYLELVYSKSFTLYEMLPNALIPSSDLTTSKSLDTPTLTVWLVPCLKLPRNLLRRRNMYQTLVPIIPPKIHPVLVKPLRFMLSSLQQQIRPLKVKIWERVRPNPMPQNNIFLNHLLTMLLEGSWNIPRYHLDYEGQIRDGQGKQKRNPKSSKTAQVNNLQAST